MSQSSPPSDLRSPAAETGSATAAGAASLDQNVLRALIDAMPARAVFLDAGYRYRYANREFLDFVGRSEAQIIGRHVAEVLGPNLFDAYLRSEDQLRAGECVRWEGWADYGAYGNRYIRATLTPYAPEGGPIQGIIAIGRDLTDLKLRDRELSERIEAQEASEAIHAAVVASALDCIIVIDQYGRVVEFNPAAESVFGYTRARALGQPIAQLIVPPEMRGRHNAGLENYLKTGEASVLGRRVELEAMRADGSRLMVELAITEVRSGASRLFAAHLRDLTESHRATAELERQREALYQSEKLAALGSLLAGVAHELNNPLSIVIGQAQILRELTNGARTAPTRPELATRSTKIEMAANRCARIVRTFLAMARQRKAQPSQVDIGTVIEGALDLLAYGLRTSDIETAVKLQPGIPPLWADGDQLHQVLVNLIVNARQALEECNAIRRRIVIEADYDEAHNETRIVVSDNGPGVPAPIRHRIFEPFFTTKPQEMGTGIGLAVSRGLVESQGGSLLLEPNPHGCGARFVVRMPLGREKANGEREASRTPNRWSVRTGRALIVDDETEIAALLAEMLVGLGFSSDLAYSGTEARTRLSNPTTEYDIVLCDIRMPDGDGPALFDWLQQHRPTYTQRIGFITGDTLGPAAGRFLARSGCPVIEKPVTPEDLRRLVEMLKPSPPAEAGQS